MNVRMIELDLPEKVDTDLLRDLVSNREWFHTMDLGHGIVTPGIDETLQKVERLGLPESLNGKSVLDIGAYDGAFSFEAERRGAKRVLATDDFCWGFSQGMGDGRGFDIARWALASRVEKLRIRVEDISPETVGVFDYVLFLGVLYHAEDPLGYLRRVFSVCRDTAIIETEVDGLDYDKPVMVFYPGDSKWGDPTNFWGPNEACVEAMLIEVGFKAVEAVECKWDSGARMVFHAKR
jgi:tRNA (mo5U34)-methyltransferase